MSDMSHHEMLKRPVARPLEDMSASSLLAGQQEGVAEARQAREADHARRMEELSQEAERLTSEIADQDGILALTQISIEKSQKAIADQPDSPAARIHEKVLAASQKEIDNALDKKAELVGKKSAIDDLRTALIN